MEWLRRVGSGAERPGGSGLLPAEKLRGYYDLAKEAGGRAIEADEQGRAGDALRLYSTALEIIAEGLALQVQSSGLSAKADNVASWRSQLAAWQGSMRDRVAQLSAARGAAAAPPDARRIMAPPRILPDAAALAAMAAPPAPQPSLVIVPRGQAGAGGRGAQQARGRGAAPAGAGGAAGAAAAAAGALAARAALSKEDEKLRALVSAEILDASPSVSFDDIAGLRLAKQALQEAVILPTLRADIFSGLRAPVRGILLYGPPGNGKTMLAKALASESAATFFNISASSLTSKWVGEGEKLVRALFAMAVERQPSIIFIDEIDSLLSARSAGEHDAARRLKTEFLVQFDGVAGAGASDARVVVIGATNRPGELDDAQRLRRRRRRRRRARGGRAPGVRHTLSARDLARVVASTEGYSASDLTALCREAALGPVRELGPSALARVSLDRIRPVGLPDFADALGVIRPSLSREQLQAFESFTREFGAQ
ncbi:spast [Scenedesmus sp. PABB004]|nr:spast [Scenedesmus sp. PABB004]